MSIERESIEFDVLFVGGGPASLAGAIKLMQLAQEKGKELEVALIEKGAEIGSHALSGAVMNPMALNELIPDYTDKGCPLEATVRGDEFYFLTENSAFSVPFVPKHMHNTGNLIISLSRLVRWLGQIAEEMGLNIFPGFAGKEVLYGEDQKTIIGVRTGDQGLIPMVSPNQTLSRASTFMPKSPFSEKGHAVVCSRRSLKNSIFLMTKCHRYLKPALKRSSNCLKTTILPAAKATISI